MKPKIKFFIPENCCVDELLPGLSKTQIDKRYYLIDSLYLRGLICKLKDDDFIPVNYKVLDQVVGSRNVKKVKDELVNCGILESDETYMKGFKSIGYRFAPQFCVEFRACPIWRTSFAEKINKIQIESQALVRKTPSFAHVMESLERLEIDFKSAWSFIEATHQGRALESRTRALEFMEERRLFGKADSQGRFYNNFVQMAKDIRKFATIDGEPIFQADYSCLQPSLLAMFYPSDCCERKKFVAAVCGGFYEFLADRYRGKNFNLVDQEDKRAFKDLVFSNYLFCTTGIRSEMRDIFESEFPKLCKILFAFKGGVAGTRREFYSRLPCELQAIEAEMVMQTAIPALTDLDLNIPVLSVHDCIATTEEHLSLVQRVMKDVFFQKLGFEIQVKSSRVTGQN